MPLENVKFQLTQDAEREISIQQVFDDLTHFLRSPMKYQSIFEYPRTVNTGAFSDFV